MRKRTLSELAELCGATLEGDGDLPVRGPASLDEAGPEDISFLIEERHMARFEATRAGAVIVPRAFESPRDDLALLRSDEPNRAFSAVVLAFAEDFAGPDPEPGIHPTALVDATAVIGARTHVGPFCVIGPGARIGEDCVLHERVSVHDRAAVGDGTELHAGVVLRSRVRVGSRCALHPGVVVGADGFGYDPEPPTGWRKVPQCGGVAIGDDVEIGANTCIDRGRFGDTRIGNGVKIDNLVQIGHNCVVQDNALLCAQVGVAGSTTLGPWVVAGGGVGFNGHIHVGAGARVGGKGAVFHDLEGGVEYLGEPSRPRGEYLREITALRRLPELRTVVRQLEKRIAALEGGPE